MGKISICGLGPADAKFIPPETKDLIESGTAYFRTSLHPAAQLFKPAGSFDELYKADSTFEETYKSIESRLVSLSDEVDDLVYVTPGSPLIQEDVTQLLIANSNCEVTLFPAMSFMDLCWARLGIDPINSGVQLIDGQRYSEQASGPGPKLVSQVYSKNILSEIKLSIDDPSQQPATLLQNLGCEDEIVTEVAWHELDQVIEPNNLTSIYIPATGAVAGSVVNDLVELITTLRSECPWDAKQTHDSLTKHLIEESGEVVEAIAQRDQKDSGMMDLEEELGDLLLQVLLHSELAKETGDFDFYNVVETLTEKMIRRHPHVFGDSTAQTDEELNKQWAQIKESEKANRKNS